VEAWRKAHHMSQKSMALALGLAPGGGKKTIWNIENGRHGPSYMTQEKFEQLKLRYERNKNGIAIRNRTEASIG
jgi:transcriptional regulator with XRE-family HTH domain